MNEMGVHSILEYIRMKLIMIIMYHKGTQYILPRYVLV
jgi:hypothetical protein